MKSFAYICGPFTASLHMRELNIYNAKAVALMFWKLGYTVICPHANSGDFYAREVKEEDFIEGYLDMLELLSSRKNTKIVLLPGYEHSAGSCKELSSATILGMEIIKLTEKQLKEAKKEYVASRKRTNEMIKLTEKQLKEEKNEYIAFRRRTNEKYRRFRN